LADLFSNIATQKRRVGTIAPKRFVTKLKKENGMFIKVYFILKDQSAFGDLMPCDRAQNLEHLLLLRHYLKI
jgi:hypothetical protein